LLGAAAISGCGLRVPQSEVRSAAAAAEGAGGSSGSSGTGTASGSAGGASNGLTTSAGANGSTGAGGTGSSGAGGPAGSGGSASTGSGSSGRGVTGGSSGTSGGTGGATAGGSGPSATVPAGGNGGSTAVGVTANSITVGNVSDVGGPVPGLFAGGPDGTQAYFDYINSQGGIFGRMIHLQISDDSLQCSNNEADYDNTVGSVFAYVGSWSLDDNCGATVMKAHPQVPMVQAFLSTAMQDLPNAFAEVPYTNLINTGPFLWFKQKYPTDITSVGTIVGNQGSAVAAWQHTKQAIQSIGYKVVYEDDFPPAQSDFTADVIRMKSQGVKFVLLQSVNAPDAAIFASEAAEQGFKPAVWACAVCYAGSYISESGGAANVQNQYAFITFADFLGDQGNPEVNLFLSWLHRAFPSFTPDEFAAESWANAALFVNALKQAGPDLTQQKVLAALSSTNVFNDNNMVTSADVGKKSPSNCYNILQIQSGNWTKVADPPTGFRCDGSFVP
jgi:ABC-type branched-subunit amino acid transport system substrate-binding protein